MKIHKILVLLTAVSLLLTSCSNKPVNSNNLNDNPETEVIQLAPDYTVKKVETDFDIISGISNGEIYGIDYSTYYSVYYSNSESPEQSFFFPSDLAGIFYLKELNDKVYIYGYNQEDQYKIYIFSSDMKEYSEILFNDGHCTSIAPLSDGRIFVSVLDGYKNYLRIYSPEGEILNTVYPECMNVGNSLWINDSTVTDDDTIVISVEENYFGRCSL